MKITVILLFVALFQAVAIESSYSQSVTVSIKAERISLTELFSPDRETERVSILLCR